MSSPWTHALCGVCYARRMPGRTPTRVLQARETGCCDCKILTREGIFMRGNPAEFQCKGRGAEHDDEQPDV